MEQDLMGRVLTEATIENLGDLMDVGRGLRSPDDVRRITVSDALVDTGATTLALPTRFIQQLGLKEVREKSATTFDGTRQVAVHEPVRLTLQGRSMSVDTVEVPDVAPVLIGQIPLEALDLVVDPKGQRLIGNPAHNGEEMLELY